MSYCVIRMINCRLPAHDVTRLLHRHSDPASAADHSRSQGRQTGNPQPVARMLDRRAALVAIVERGPPRQSMKSSGGGSLTCVNGSGRSSGS
jgi:hypothetical protein